MAGGPLVVQRSGARDEEFKFAPGLQFFWGPSPRSATAGRGEGRERGRACAMVRAQSRAGGLGLVAAVLVCSLPACSNFVCAPPGTRDAAPSDFRTTAMMLGPADRSRRGGRGGAAGARVGASAVRDARGAWPRTRAATHPPRPNWLPTPALQAPDNICSMVRGCGSCASFLFTTPIPSPSPTAPNKAFTRVSTCLVDGSERRAVARERPHAPSSAPAPGGRRLLSRQRARAARPRPARRCCARAPGSTPPSPRWRPSRCTGAFAATLHAIGKRCT